jgi:hypothetical protein
MALSKFQSSTVSIEASFGSDMQRDVAMRVLREFLDEWKTYTEERHKRTQIIIDYGDKPAA